MFGALPPAASTTPLPLYRHYGQHQVMGRRSSIGSGSAHTASDGDKDPFLSLLEQLAENENSRGGPSELDFYLSGGAG